MYGLPVTSVDNGYALLWGSKLASLDVPGYEDDLPLAEDRVEITDRLRGVDELHRAEAERGRRVATNTLPDGTRDPGLRIGRTHLIS